MKQKISNLFKNEMVSGIFLVMLGNIALLFAKLVMWLIVPKMLGVSEYGYYKTFTLYLAYIMLLHFGFPDGILLIYGGKEYEEIDKAEFRVYSRFFSAFLIAISIVGTTIGFLVMQGTFRYIVCMLGIDALFINLGTYFKFVSQATMRFKELTKRNFMEAVLQILLIGAMVLLSRLRFHHADGRTYILGLVLIDAVILIWYMSRYRDIIWGMAVKVRWDKIKKIFKTGILLTMAFQVSHLVFVLDRQMVSLLFDIDTYSLYSFAYSVVNMITAAISAVATVLLPSLKRIDTETAMTQYPAILSGLIGIVFLLLAFFFPLSYFIRWFLPEYLGSLQYIEVILPGLAISSCINIVIFTYYKVLGQLKQYLHIALGALVTGLLLNCGGYYYMQEPIMFAVASIVTLLCWYLAVQRSLIKKYKVEWLRNFVHMCFLLLWFYIVTAFSENMWLAMLWYLFGYLLITLVKKVSFKKKVR